METINITFGASPFTKLYFIVYWDRKIDKKLDRQIDLKERLD